MVIRWLIPLHGSAPVAMLGWTNVPYRQGRTALTQSPVYRVGSWAGNVRDEHGVDWVVEEATGP